MTLNLQALGLGSGTFEVDRDTSYASCATHGHGLGAQGAFVIIQTALERHRICAECALATCLSAAAMQAVTALQFTEQQFLEKAKAVFLGIQDQLKSRRG
jgi:hypothetical protein